MTEERLQTSGKYQFLNKLCWGNCFTICMKIKFVPYLTPYAKKIPDGFKLEA
jgi:hypothetical protein